MVDKADDEMVHALADGARERLRKAIDIAEKSRQIRFQRMVDIEAICLAGDRAPPKRWMLFFLRCPRCGGKLSVIKLRVFGQVGMALHKHYSCVSCNYEWAKGDTALTAANRGIVHGIVAPPKDTKAKQRGA